MHGVKNELIVYKRGESFGVMIKSLLRASKVKELVSSFIIIIHVKNYIYLQTHDLDASLIRESTQKISIKKLLKITLALISKNDDLMGKE